MNNNNLKLWLIIPVCAIVLLLGGTYAWYVWQTSQDEETIIATDTGYAQVFFDGGSDLNGKLKPVSDKTKGMSKTITVKADKAFIEPISFNLYLDINSIDENLKHESFKFELYKDGNLVKTGNFSETYLTSALSECSKNEGVSHITLTSDVVTTTESVYTLYTWIDGNMSNPIGMEGKDFDFTLHADGQHAILVDPLVHNGIIPEGGTYITGIIEVEEGLFDMSNITTYTAGQTFPETVEHGDIYRYGDYEYKYGYSWCHDCQTWDSCYHPYDDNDGWGVGTLDNTKENYGAILSVINDGYVTSLVATFGSLNLTVAPAIPSTIKYMNYTFERCIRLVTAPEIPDSVTNMAGTFNNCKSLVTAPKIPDSVTNMNNTFSNCTSLENVPKISNSVTDMSYTFYGCESLVNAPKIPDSVTDMYSTFSKCTSLVNAPEIPNSVTKMENTFSDCTSLVNAPEIPDLVIDMGCTFSGCTSLVNAPEIPDLVTDMEYTFNGCTSLTGNVKIKSQNVSKITSIFRNTIEPITVEVPEGSTTYDNISANGVVPENVTITTFVKE